VSSRFGAAERIIEERRPDPALVSRPELHARGPAPAAASVPPG
jgi:hypothetical protein